jgi:hypothetical protein
MMDAIREQLSRPLVAGIVGFVIGAIFGLVVLGWGLFPVEWVDAAPEDLRVEWQEEYLRMSIHTYARTQNAAAARQRWQELGDAGPEILTRIQESPACLAEQDILNFQTAVGVEPPPVEPTPTPTPTPDEAPVRGILTWLFPVMCLLTLLLGGALVALYFLRSRGGRPSQAIQGQESTHQAEWTDYSAIGEEPPMAQFMASYRLGDDLFDDSFSIDSQSGEFLGECGVGISDTIGVGDPKKVSAFEVWLFDKNDIQTVTKVIMSAHSFEDESIRQRLMAKGEPVEAQPGGQVMLETATLQLVARVVDMAYGQGALPEQSFFESMVLELAIWQKS